MINLEREVRDYLKKQGTGQYDIMLKPEYVLNAEMNGVLHTLGFNNRQAGRNLFADFHGELREDSFVLVFGKKSIEIPYNSVYSCEKLLGLPQRFTRATD